MGSLTKLVETRKNENLLNNKFFYVKNMILSQKDG